MAARPTTARVAFAAIRLREEPAGQPGLFISADAPALLDSLRPGAQVTRYGRLWRMARWRRVDDRFVVGRIGYQSPSPTETWNAARSDFEPTEMVAGHTSPFAVDLVTMRVAFQLRSNRIQVMTFTENFRALLEIANQVHKWEVRPEGDAPPWDEWLRSIGRLSEVRVKIVRPNPTYDFEEAERLLEDAHARSLELIAKAGPTDVEGIRIDKGWLVQVIDHARDHGTWSAKGETVHGEPTQWTERDEGRPRTVRGDVDPITTEVMPERLVEEVGGVRPSSISTEVAPLPPRIAPPEPEPESG